MKNVYDFDGTIYDGDSTIDFYIYCLKRKKSILKYLFYQMFYMLLYFLKVKNKVEMKEAFFIFLKDFSNPKELVNQFWKDNHKIKKWYLQKHRKNDIVISASPKFLIEVPLKKLKIKNIIASDVDIKTGKFNSENVYGTEKVKILIKKHLDLKIDEAYTDNESDLPLLKLAKKGYIVKKNKIYEYNKYLDKKNLIITIFKYILFLLSLMCFSLLMNLVCCVKVSETYRSSIITIVAVLIFFIFTFKHDILKKTPDKKVNSYRIFSILLTISYLNKMFCDYIDLPIIRMLLYDNAHFKIVIESMIAISSYSVYKIILLCNTHLINYFKTEIKKSDIGERKFYIISNLIFIPIIILWYSFIDKYSLQNDLFYSIDIKYVAEKMFPNILWFLDFRHIFFSYLTFPIVSLFKWIAYFLPLNITHYYIFLAIFNMNILLFSAIMLKRILKDETFMYLYLLSFPTIFYSIIVEKYQLCVFLIILFIYIRTGKKENKNMEDFSLISSVGAISTSVILGFWSNRQKGLKKLKSWIAVGLKFIVISIVLGKWNILSTMLDSVKFSGKMPIINRFYGVTELISSCIIGSPSSNIDGLFLWNNRAEYLNIFGLTILIICILSFIRHRKELFFKICFSWLIFMLILFIGFNWYCYEAPLFNLYFSFAILVLSFQFIKDFFSKSSFYKEIWLSLFIVIIINNLHLMIKLFYFLNNY